MNMCMAYVEDLNPCMIYQFPLNTVSFTHGISMNLVVRKPGKQTTTSVAGWRPFCIPVMPLWFIGRLHQAVGVNEKLSI